MAAGGVLLAAALGISTLVPSEELMQSSYVTEVRELGVPVDLRAFSVTVTRVRLADRVQTPEWIGTTDGVWLVVDLQFERRIERGGITAGLRIGPNRYVLSTRADLDALDQGASGQPGLPWAGSILVELPESVLELPGADDAVLRIGTDADAFLDDVAELHLDLGSLEHERSVTILPPARVAS
ncbi:MAG: hypothetical protein KF727_04700 [Microbacteriaceae bacterium]|nr:hypothetical protein [Microbacteriaceae bacterium]